MIDEKKLAQELGQHLARWGYAEPYSEGVRAGIRIAMDVAKEQPILGGWIPCSERLPEPYDTVLLTGKMLEDKEPLVYMGCINGKKEWQLLGGRNPFDYITTAWQPLPEPYKEGLNGRS